MLTDAQVRLLRRKIMERKTQAAAAAAAGMCERSARTWQRGLLPSETKTPRGWRTRVDPFAAVWDGEVVPLLEADEKRALEASTVLDELDRRHRKGLGPGQLRTLQRRMRDWRAVHGPEREVFFEQVCEPGEQAAIDFTHGEGLRVTVLGHSHASASTPYTRWSRVAQSMRRAAACPCTAVRETGAEPQGPSCAGAGAAWPRSASPGARWMHCMQSGSVPRDASLPHGHAAPAAGPARAPPVGSTPSGVPTASGTTLLRHGELGANAPL
jgi:hypothetical protein